MDTMIHRRSRSEWIQWLLVRPSEGIHPPREEQHEDIPHRAIEVTATWRLTGKYSLANLMQERHRYLILPFASNLFTDMLLDNKDHLPIIREYITTGKT